MTNSSRHPSTASTSGATSAGRSKPTTTPLTVLCGFDRAAVADVAAGILLRAPRVAVVWADPFTAELGYVQSRVTDSDGRCTEEVVELEHGCLSCAMREAVVSTVRRLHRTGRYDQIVVHLHPGIESDAAVLALDSGLAGTARVDTVATVLHEGWLDDLAGDGDVADMDIAIAVDDARSAAVVLAAALDTASVLIVPAEVGDAFSLEEHATLSALCPDAIRHLVPTCLDVATDALLATGSFDADARTAFGRRGLLDPHLRLPAVSGELGLVRWRSAGRPVHPQRLRDALDHLADGVIRSAGYLWVATHPDSVVLWHSAGDCLSLGPSGPWPDAARAQHLSFLGYGLQARHMHEVLEQCLLTEAETALGPSAWPRLDDPFPEWADTGMSDEEKGAA